MPSEVPLYMLALPNSLFARLDFTNQAGYTTDRAVADVCKRWTRRVSEPIIISEEQWEEFVAKLEEDTEGCGGWDWERQTSGNSRLCCE